MSLILLFKSSMDDCGADLWSVDCRFSSHSACPLALPHVAPGSYRLVPLTAVSECAYEWVKRSETVRHFGPSKKAVKHFLSVFKTRWQWKIPKKRNWPLERVENVFTLGDTKAIAGVFKPVCLFKGHIILCCGDNQAHHCWKVNPVRKQPGWKLPQCELISKMSGKKRRFLQRTSAMCSRTQEYHLKKHCPSCET